MSAEDSKALQENLNEEKITKMLALTQEHVFQVQQPTNAEMVVFALCVVRMMMQRAIESRTGYPRKMQIGTPSGHKLNLEIQQPSTAPLDQVNQILASQAANGNKPN